MELFFQNELFGWLKEALAKTEIFQMCYRQENMLYSTKPHGVIPICILLIARPLRPKNHGNRPIPDAVSAG